MTLRIIGLCVAAAMLCAAIRTVRPEMAMAVSLAVGVGVMGMICVEAGRNAQFREGIDLIRTSAAGADGAVLRAAGIAVVSELASQVCSDTGEGALAARILFASRIVMLGICLPMLADLSKLLSGVLS